MKPISESYGNIEEFKNQIESATREELEKILEDLSNREAQVRKEKDALIISSIDSDEETRNAKQKEANELDKIIGSQENPGIAQYKVLVRDEIVNLKFGKYKKLYRKLQEIKEKTRNFKQELKKLTETIKENIPEIDLSAFQTLIVDPLENLSINEDSFSAKNITEIDNTINSICEKFTQYFTDQDIRDAFVKTLTNQLTTNIREQKRDIAALNANPNQTSTRIALLFKELHEILEDKITEENETKPGLISQKLVSRATGDRVKETWKLSDELLRSINEAKRERENFEMELAKTTINDMFSNHYLRRVFEDTIIYRSRAFDKTANKKKAALEIEKAIITGSNDDIENILEKWGFTLGTEKVGEKIKQNYYYSQFNISLLGETIKKAADGNPIKAKAGFFTKLKSGKKSSTILFIDRINKAFQNRDIPTIKKSLEALGFEEEPLSQAITEIEKIMPVASEDLISTTTLDHQEELTREEDLFGPTSDLAKACENLRDYQIAINEQLSSEIKSSPITDDPYLYVQNPILEHTDHLNLLLTDLLRSEESTFEDIDVTEGFTYKSRPRETLSSYNQTIQNLTDKLVKYLNNEKLLEAIEESGSYYELLETTKPNTPASLFIKSLNYYPDLLNKIKNGADKFNQDNYNSLRHLDMRIPMENLEFAITLANQRADELATRKLFGYENKEISTYLINSGCLIDHTRKLTNKEASEISSKITKTIATKQDKKIVTVLEKYGFLKPDLSLEDKQKIASQIKKEFYLNKISSVVKNKIKEALKYTPKVHSQTGSATKIIAALHGERSTTTYLINRLNANIRDFNNTVLKGNQKKQEKILAKIIQDFKNLGISDNKSAELIEIIKLNAPRKALTENVAHHSTKTKFEKPILTTSTTPIPQKNKSAPAL